MGYHKQPPFMQTQRPRYVPWDCGAKQTSTPGLGINLDIICNNSHPTV